MIIEESGAITGYLHFLTFFFTILDRESILLVNKKYQTFKCR